MREIVINTGPIIALVAGVESIEWLPDLYSRILIPYEVYKELEDGGPGNPELIALNSLRNHIQIEKQKTDLPTELLRELDCGEASVIQNAKINKIETVAIDEKAGRRLARIHGLKVTGSLGILLKAKRQGRVADPAACIARMRQHRVWISADLEEEFLRRVGEL